MAIIRKNNQERFDEPLDRNKTDLTHFVTACAIGYLANRGFHPVETEVSSCIGIVDVGSFCYPTPTEAKQIGLIENAKAPRLRFESNYDEIMFQYGHLLTAAIEVKTSRSDFKKDLNTKFSGKLFPAHLCYIAYPKGMLERQELPGGWIGLEVYPSERVVKKIWAMFPIHPMHPGDVADFIAQIAIRREYRTKFAAHRAWLKMYRAKGW